MLPGKSAVSRRAVPVIIALACMCAVQVGVTRAGEDVARFRTINGAQNNSLNPDWGRAGVELERWAPPAYADGVSAPAGARRPSARVISNTIFAQQDLIPNDQRWSDLVWMWGQFVDHDIDITFEAAPVESFDVIVPLGDVVFDPFFLGNATIPLHRSAFATPGDVRQQLNDITAWIDASNVYGSDDARAMALRTLDGTGRLKTSDGNLLPFNTAALPNAATGEPANFFLAGDVRANEQVGLTALHTLFVREHNFWAEELERSGMSGDEIYQLARERVVAEMQAITYNEFLPILLGNNALAPYRGYQEQVNPNVANLFSTAAYRFGHSMLSPTLLRLDAQMNEIPAGHLTLQQAFFNPTAIIEQGIEPILRGASEQVAQQVDAKVIDGVRNFLFGAPGSPGFDLVSLNIQRGRDHGLPDYNSVRRSLGLPAAETYADITTDPQLQGELLMMYPDINDIDVWVGGLAEDHFQDALVGQTFWTIIKRQFEALRDGDRYWYENVFEGGQRRDIRNTRLAEIVRRNTSIAGELEGNVWRVAPPDQQQGPPRRRR